MTGPDDGHFNGAGLSRRDALKLTGGVLALPLARPAEAASRARESQSVGTGREQAFDLDWHFTKSSGRMLEAANLDDSGWRLVDLPHDWSIEDLPSELSSTAIGPFDKNAEGGGSTGYTIGGEGWYRKHFRVDGIPVTDRVEILFQGVAVTSEVWINGTQIGSQVHAYAPFAFDLSPYLNRAGDNVVAVRVRNLGRNSRWYAGSGIYRPVTIDVVPNANRIARWGVSAWTRRIARGIAEIDVTTAIAAAQAGTLVRVSLKEPDGTVVASRQSHIEANEKQTLKVTNPRLWSVHAPNLYTLSVELVRSKQVVDRIDQDFGIRIVDVDPELGLQVNGERVILRGGCIHHDNGLLGAAAFADSDERRILRLKERGFNAIRSSHNPASASVRQACDRHGLLLIEESFDAWHVGKLPDDYARYFKDHWREHLSAMVLPARNSPSVIMWSIGNEIPERSSVEGVEWSWRLANEVRRLDPTRPVTAAINQWIGHPMVAQAGTARPGHEGQVDQASTIFLDVAGYNYRLGYIDAEHKKYPHRVIFGSETYARDAYDYQELARRAPYVLGEFVWTAMDYLGEVGIGIPASGKPPAPEWPPVGFPQIGAFCGDLDLIGGQKPQSLWRDVVWGVSPLEVTVQRPLPPGEVEWLTDWGWSDELASWTWPGSEGKLLSVRVYSSGDRVSLVLNGRQVATSAMTAENKMRAESKVPYAPGILEAIAWRGNHEIGRKRLTTSGPAARLQVEPESRLTSADRQSLSFINIEVLDAGNRPLLDDNRTIDLTVNGPAELVAFGTGRPLAASFGRQETRTWHGRALAILRSHGTPGTVRIEARSDGLLGGAADVKFK